MNIKFEKLLSIPKSLYVCLRLLPLRQAIKLPILVRYNSLILSTKGKVTINGNVKIGMLNIGFEEIGIFDKTYQRSILQIDGHVIIMGTHIDFGQGVKICILKHGTLILGKNVKNTGEMQLICNNHIQIHDDVLISWNTLIMDTDFHQIFDLSNNSLSNINGSITIYENVWIGARCTILKNTSIPKGCIIAANACCNKNFGDENCLLAGIPAKIRKRNITRNIQK